MLSKTHQSKFTSVKGKWAKMATNVKAARVKWHEGKFTFCWSIITKIIMSRSVYDLQEERFEGEA